MRRAWSGCGPQQGAQSCGQAGHPVEPTLPWTRALLAVGAQPSQGVGTRKGRP